MSSPPISKTYVPLLLIGMLVASPTAFAVAPLPLFTENFDNAVAANTPAAHQPWLINQYVSAATDYAGNPIGETYSAIATEKYAPTDTLPYWANPTYCNGIWVSASMANPNTGAPAGSTLICNGRQNDPAAPGNSGGGWKNLQILANVLGQVTNPTANTKPSQNNGNHIIAAYTESFDNLGSQELTILKTNKGIPVPVGGRFLTFSVAAAALNCGTNLDGQPQYMFKLIKQDSSELAMNTTALNPCTSPLAKEFKYDAAQTDVPGYLPLNTANGSSVFAAQMTADKAYLITDSTVNLRFTNLNSRGNGNDAAFDNIVMLDVSPNLAKSFSPTKVTVGQTATLTFTATNTTDLLEKTGWTFNDTLPAGMVVAAAPNIVNSCGSSTVAAAAGSNTIAVTNGNLTKGTASCTISVDVTVQGVSPVPAGGLSFKNDFGTQPGAGVVTTTALVPTTGTTLTVMPAADMAAVPTPPENFAIGVPGSITTQCVNNGPDVAVAATCVVDISTLPSGAQTVCTPASGSTNLNVGDKISCVTSFTMNQAGTVTLSTTAGSSSTDPNPNNNTQPGTVKAVSPATDMQAIAPTDATASVGTQTSVTTSCKNNGPDAAANATCTVTGAPTGATTVCTPASPQASLPVGQSMSCVTTFTPTTADPISLTTTIGTTTSEVNTQNNAAVTKVTVGTTAPAGGPAAVPTLGEWALMLLTALLAGVGVLRLRRTRMG